MGQMLDQLRKHSPASVYSALLLPLDRAAKYPSGLTVKNCAQFRADEHFGEAQPTPSKNGW
jgi:hypothetical protein